MIGINTAVIRAPGSEGLGFAIQINLANDVAQQVLTTGRVRRAFLGIEYRDLEPEIASTFDLPVKQGVIVADVSPGSPAARAPGTIAAPRSGCGASAGGDPLSGRCSARHSCVGLLL